MRYGGAVFSNLRGRGEHEACAVDHESTLPYQYEHLPSKLQPTLYPPCHPTNSYNSHTSSPSH